MAKCDAVPVSAVNVMMNTLVPTAVFNSYPRMGVNTSSINPAASSDKTTDKAYNRTANPVPGPALIPAMKHIKMIISKPPLVSVSWESIAETLLGEYFQYFSSVWTDSRKCKVF